MKRIWIASVAWLVAILSAQAAEIDPALVGVWVDSPGKNRIEITADGELILWSYRNNQTRGWSTSFKYENTREIEMAGPSRFSMPILGPLVSNPRNGTGSFWHSGNQTDTFISLDDDGNLRLTRRNTDEVPISTRPIDWQYSIEEKGQNIVLEFSPVQQARSVIRYQRLQFDKTVDRIDNGPRVLHDRLVYEASFRDALENGDSARFVEMVASTDAAFLRDEAMWADKTTAARAIAYRTYGEVMNRQDLTALKGVYAHTSIAPEPEHIRSNYSDDIKTYLWGELGIDPNSLSSQQLVSLNLLLIQRNWDMFPLQLKRLYSRYGCSNAHELQYQNQAMQAETPEEKAEQEAVSAARSDPGQTFRIMVEAMEICLNNFDNGKPYPTELLSASTIPGKSAATDDKGLTNPLFYYADPMFTVRGYRSQQVLNMHTYHLMLVLLDAGADPSRRPSAAHPSLAEYMYTEAPHQEFTSALERFARANNRSRADSAKGSVMLMIDAYNEIMNRIGGPPYRPPNEEAAPMTTANEAAASSPQTKTDFPVTDTPGVLALENPSFEGPRTGQYTFGVDSWQGERHGVVMAPATMFPDARVPAGRQIAFLSRPDSWMSQSLPFAAAPNWRYTVQVFAGLRLEDGFEAGQFDLELRAGNQVVARQRFDTPDKGEFAATTLVYDSGEEPPSGALSVLMRNVNTRQINFDLVQVYGYEAASGQEPPSLSWENAVNDPSPAVASSLPTTNSPAAANSVSPSSPPEWETVGFWDYDAVDGQLIPGGLTLVEQAGSGLGKSWQRHLELKDHGKLRGRQRTLWPVELNRAGRKVCVNYPNYPSYSASVDLDGDEHDGTYAFGPCD